MPKTLTLAKQGTFTKQSTWTKGWKKGFSHGWRPSHAIRLACGSSFWKSVLSRRHQPFTQRVTKGLHITSEGGCTQQKRQPCGCLFNVFKSVSRSKGESLAGW